MPATMLMMMLTMVAIVFMPLSIRTIRRDCNHATPLINAVLLPISRDWTSPRSRRAIA
jgi:hypothetical protein